MIHYGDLFDVLPTIDAESIDACVTDPPYELDFMGKHWDGTGVAFKVETWRAVYRVLKPGAYLVAFGGTRTSHRMVCAIEDAGFDVRDSLVWLHGQGFPKNHNLGNGKGTALKPANEPIALAWKPFKGTISGCHEKHGTAALNIEACRVGDADTRHTKHGGRNDFPHEDDSWTPKTIVGGSECGRWPANVLLDEVAAAALDEQTGELTSGARVGGDIQRLTDDAVLGYRVARKGGHSDASIGGASRFYYVAKPSREERDFGCDGLPRVSAAEITGRKEGSAGLQNPRAGVRAGSMDRDTLERAARNTHPTVKPVELMRWLVKLVTPIDGTVLDPFTGSGTTGMACVYEQRQFIGIEREAEYVEIAKRRIGAVAPLFNEASS